MWLFLIVNRILLKKYSWVCIWIHVPNTKPLLQLPILQNTIVVEIIIVL